MVESPSIFLPTLVPSLTLGRETFLTFPLRLIGLGNSLIHQTPVVCELIFTHGKLGFILPVETGN